MSVDALVDDNIRKDTNKLKRYTADEQNITWGAKTVNAQADHSAKEDNQTEVFE